MSSTPAPQHANRSRRIGFVLLACALAAACATSSAFHAGERAERLQDYDLAVVEYTKAARAKPDDENARPRSSAHACAPRRTIFSVAAVSRARNATKNPAVEFQIAAELNPTDSAVQTALKDARQRLRTKLTVSRGGRTELQALIDRTRDLPPPARSFRRE